MVYNPWHYVPILKRKPGALRNGAPFRDWALPKALKRVRARLARHEHGDRQVVKILAAVLEDGLEAVEAACAEALAEGPAAPTWCSTSWRGNANIASREGWTCVRASRSGSQLNAPRGPRHCRDTARLCVIVRALGRLVPRGRIRRHLRCGIGTAHDAQREFGSLARHRQAFLRETDRSQDIRIAVPDLDKYVGGGQEVVFRVVFQFVPTHSV